MAIDTLVMPEHVKTFIQYLGFIYLKRRLTGQFPENFKYENPHLFNKFILYYDKPIDLNSLRYVVNMLTFKEYVNNVFLSTWGGSRD